ncbi:MAG: Crp/Fnr family transcriptional regulator [Thiolinea sp.]
MKNSLHHSSCLTAWPERFPGLSNLNTETRKLLVERSVRVNLPEESMVFGPGIVSENMLFLLGGTVRVQQTSETGREIVLYRARAGESCVMTTACLFAFEDYATEGIAETPVQAASVPRSVFDDLVAQSQEFRHFVLSAFSKRMTGLFQVIDEVAFQRLDVRLADKLLQLSAGQDAVATTHQKMSVELGTAREVISRQLQEFQRRGWIEQSRGRVRILQRGQLEQLSDKNS